VDVKVLITRIKDSIEAHTSLPQHFHACIRFEPTKFLAVNLYFESPRGFSRN